jgi:uncharacterized membrane protein YgcG
MAQAWFSNNFGQTRTTLSNQASAVGDDPYQLAQSITITPIWSQAAIASYMRVNPILFVPVRPIPFLDEAVSGYVLVFYRDSTGATQSKLQVYCPDSLYLVSHVKCNMSDFKGMMFQIDMSGHIGKIFKVNNGRVTTELFAHLRDPNHPEDGGPTCPGMGGNIKHFTSSTPYVFDGSSSGITIFNFNYGYVPPIEGGGDSGGNGGGGGSGGGSGSGSSGGGLGDEFGDNGMFDMTDERATANYVAHALNLGRSGRDYLIDNSLLGTQMYYYLLETGSEDAKRIATLHYNFFLSDAEYANFQRTNNFSVTEVPFAIFVERTKSVTDPIMFYKMMVWWMKKTPQQRQRFVDGFANQAGDFYGGLIGMSKFYTRWTREMFNGGRYCVTGNCLLSHITLPLLNSNMVVDLFNTYKDIINKAIQGDAYAEGQLMFEAMLFLTPIEELNAARGLNATTLFRGTTEGFAGNAVLRTLEISPTSIDPAIATLFATHGSNFGTGVIHVASIQHLKNLGVKFLEGNVLEFAEREIPVGIKPADFATKAQITISVTKAKRILSDMGINMPSASSVRTIESLNTYINQMRPLTQAEIERFIIEANR